MDQLTAVQGAKPPTPHLIVNVLDVPFCRVTEPSPRFPIVQYWLEPSGGSSPGFLTQIGVPPIGQFATKPPGQTIPPGLH